MALTRRVVAAGFLTLVLLALSGGATGSAAVPSQGGRAVRGTAQAGEASLLAAAQAVLDERVAAVASGDRRRWDATVDPRAPDAFAEAQRRLFDGLRSLPLERYTLEARVEATGDLSAGMAERHSADEAFLPEVRQRLRLEGYDDRDDVATMWWTFVRRDGRWRIAADDDLADLGLKSSRGIWDGGPVEVLRTEHLLVLHRPAQAERARLLADIGERAMAAFGRSWDRPWSGRLPMIVPGSIEELGEILQTTLDLDKFVAFVSYGAVRDDGYVVTAPRLLVQDRNLSRYPAADQERILVHELAHAAGAVLAGPAIPAWVHEGVAEWVADGRPTSGSEGAGGNGRVPLDHELSSGTGAAILRAYRESASAAGHLAGRAGRGAPVELFARLGALRPEPGSPRHLTDRALREVAGMGLDDLERSWSGR